MDSLLRGAYPPGLGGIIVTVVGGLFLGCDDPGSSCQEEEQEDRGQDSYGHVASLFVHPLLSSNLKRFLNQAVIRMD